MVGDPQKIGLLRLEHQLLRQHRVRIRDVGGRMGAERLEDPSTGIDLLNVSAPPPSDPVDPLLSGGLNRLQGEEALERQLFPLCSGQVLSEEIFRTVVSLRACFCDPGLLPLVVGEFSLVDSLIPLCSPDFFLRGVTEVVDTCVPLAPNLVGRRRSCAGELRCNLGHSHLTGGDLGNP